MQPAASAIRTKYLPVGTDTAGNVPTVVIDGDESHWYVNGGVPPVVDAVNTANAGQTAGVFVVDITNGAVDVAVSQMPENTRLTETPPPGKLNRVSVVPDNT